MPRRNNGPRLRWLAKRKTFYIVWTEHGRSRERSTGTQEREEAEIIFAEWLREKQRTQGPRDQGQILITDILTDYVTERGPKIKAGERLAYAVVPLIEFWQSRTVAEITRQSCETYENWRNRSAGTVRRELGTLRAAINHAVAERRLLNAVPVHLPVRPPSRDRWLEKNEAAALLRAALNSGFTRHYLPLFIVIGLHSGARKEAILSLRWPQVDLEAGLIQWNPEGREQTNKRRPRMKIPSKLLGHLKRARMRGSDLGFVVHNDGKRLGDIKRSFATACRNAGLQGVSPHVLRHTRATWGMRAGTAPWELAGFLGMTTETLEKVYGHHHPDFQLSAAENY